MTERAAALRALAGRLRDRSAVRDAFLAKSFTDHILIVDVEGSLPDAVRDRLRAHDLEPAAAVYGEDEDVPSGFGSVGDATRHHFVDVRTRGAHQSYVLE